MHQYKRALGHIKRLFLHEVNALAALDEIYLVKIVSVVAVDGAGVVGTDCDLLVGDGAVAVHGYGLRHLLGGVLFQ